jgi:hypothetical protein
VGFELTTPGLKVSFGTCAAVRGRPSRIQAGRFQALPVRRWLPSYAQTAVNVAVKSRSGCPPRSYALAALTHTER